MSELSELFERYGTDKARNGYHVEYERILWSRRNEIRNVLEVGIGTLSPTAHSSMVGYAAPHYQPGGSLRAWRDYLPNALITGLDVQPDTQFVDTNIVTTLGDSTDSAAMDSRFYDGYFDLIIDDGDHAKQFQTLIALWPKLARGGIYVIEDVWDECRWSMMVLYGEGL